MERWLFLLRNLHRLQRLPAKLQEKVFLHLFAVAEIGRFPEAERIRYQSSLTELERMEEASKYAKMVAAEEGRTQGIAQGIAQGITQGIAQGMEQGIAQGRAEEQAKALKEKLDMIQGMLVKGSDWTFISAIAHVDEPKLNEMKASLNPGH